MGQLMTSLSRKCGLTSFLTSRKDTHGCVIFPQLSVLLQSRCVTHDHVIAADSLLDHAAVTAVEKTGKEAHARTHQSKFALQHPLGIV